MVNFMIDWLKNELTNCNRCECVTNVITISWFTTEVICLSCKDKEQLIRNQLPADGQEFEGCGFIPDLEVKEDL